MTLENHGQIARVEQLSDARHREPGDSDVMAAYLLELTPRWYAGGEREPLDGG